MAYETPYLDTNYYGHKMQALRWVEMIGFNLHAYSDFQQNIRGVLTYVTHCILLSEKVSKSQSKVCSEMKVIL